jgi:hypothetical protein
MTSILLWFSPNSDNGGSALIGYLLYADQGVAGSPSTLLYNGTGRPEIITYNATNLVTGLSYTFTLYQLNAIYASTTGSSLTVLIGTVPGAPPMP